MRRHFLLLCASAIALFSLGYSNARAQDAQDPREWGDKLFNALQHNGESAFEDRLRETFAAQSVEKFAEQVVAYFEKTEKIGGRLVGFEFITETHFGPRIRGLRYVTYNEKFFLISMLTFYQTDKGWELTAIDMTSKPGDIPWQ